MGTRSMIYIVDEDRNVLASIYTQYDGGPEGVGMKIHDVLTGRAAGYGQPIKPGNLGEIVGVIGVDNDGTERTMLVNNGMDCLAASFIKYYKEKPLNVYLYPSPTPAGDLVSDDDAQRKAFIDSLIEHAQSTGAAYMYIIYKNKDTDLIDMMCYDAYDNDEPLYSGTVHAFPKFVELLKEKEQRERQAAIELAREKEELPVEDWPDDTSELEFIDMSTIFDEEEEHAAN